MDIREFPVTTVIPMQWGDMDAFQHLNNTIYFRYFETARIMYFIKMDWFTYMKETQIGPILASTSARFKKPLYFPDELTVGARVSKLEDDHFEMEYGVHSKTLGWIAAEGQGKIVVLNYNTHEKVPIPRELKERIRLIEQASAVNFTF